MKKLAALTLVLFSIGYSYGQNSYNISIPPNKDSITLYARQAITFVPSSAYNTASGIVTLPTTGGGGATLDSTRKNYDSITAHNARIITLTTNLLNTTTSLSGRIVNDSTTASVLNSRAIADSNKLVALNLSLSNRIASDSSNANTIVAKVKADSITQKSFQRINTYPNGLTLTPTWNIDGNSIAAGQITSNAIYWFSNVVAAKTHTSVVNTAVGGSVMKNLIFRRVGYMEPYKVTQASMYECTTNDLRGTNSVFVKNAVHEGYKMLLANQFMDTVIAIASSVITKSGTWVNLTDANISSKSVIKLSAIPIKSSVAGSTLSFSWNRTTLVIGTWGVDSSHLSFGRFSVTVDGVNQGTFDPRGKAIDDALGIYDIKTPAVNLLFLSAGRHSVVITTLDNNEVDFDYIGALGHPSEVPAAIVLHAIYSNQTGYNGGFSTKARVDEANSYIDSAVKIFEDRGYPVKVARVENRFDTTLGITESGGLHPNDYGNQLIAASVLDVVNVNNPAYIVSSSISDFGKLANELATTASGTNWTGSGFQSGYVHTAGSATALTSTITPSVGQWYYLDFTGTTGTIGTSTVTFGGVSFTLGVTTLKKGIYTTSTAPLIITPTSATDVTVKLSLKVVIANTPSTTETSSDSTTNLVEHRVSALANNQFDGRYGGQRVMSGTNLTSHGNGAFANVISGLNGVAQGYNSLFNYIDGTGVIGIGPTALQALNIGSAITGIGNAAFLAGKSIDNGVAVGDNAFSSLINGIANVGIGRRAGVALTSGANNLLLGFEVARFDASGSTGLLALDNSFIAGANARVLTTGLNNVLAIGYNVISGTSNTGTYGNTSMTDHYFTGNLDLLSYTGAKTGTMATVAGFNSAGTLLQAASFKANVLNLTAARTLLLSDFGTNGEVQIYCNATTAAFTVTLPTAASYSGLKVIISKTDASANNVTVAGSGAELINAANTQTLTTQFQARSIGSNGTQSYIF